MGTEFLSENILNMYAYSYSTTNKMHLFLKLFILVKRSACFGRSFPSLSVAQNCTYSNRHMSNSCCYLLLYRMCSFELLMMGGKTEICRVFYKNK